MTGAASRVSPETSGGTYPPPRPSPLAGKGGDGTPPPGQPFDRLKGLFHGLVRTRHAALAHVRTHAAGTFCVECQRFIDSAAEAQAAYDAAWHELFDPPLPHPLPRGERGKHDGG